MSPVRPNFQLDFTCNVERENATVTKCRAGVVCAPWQEQFGCQWSQLSGGIYSELLWLDQISRNKKVHVCSVSRLTDTFKTPYSDLELVTIPHSHPKQQQTLRNSPTPYPPCTPKAPNPKLFS